MQLSKKEIMEIMGLALAGYDLDNTPTGNYKKAERYRNNEDKYIRKMEAILQALETNGILCLVEGSAEPQEKDLLYCPVWSSCLWVSGFNKKHNEFMLQSNWTAGLQFPDKGLRKDEPYFIIQRNSIPAYHCKPETQEAE